MKTHLLFARAILGVLVLLGGISRLRAEINVRLSVKFILSPAGDYPVGGSNTIGTNSGFQFEVDRGNAILATTARGQKLQVIEYIAIQPPVPAGSNANYWYTVPARGARSTIENAALTDPVAWRWNPNALNIYVNSSSSGQCSFPGNGFSISLGQSIVVGTVLHEIGHFFNLRHTHTNDYTNNTNPLTFTLADLGDGDGLVETARDNPNITNVNQLCVAYFNKAYTNANAAEQAVVDSAYENVMSYHNENVLLSVQMDLWGQAGNGARLYSCSGRTWFAANGGSDGASGADAASPFGTLLKGLSSVGGSADVVLLRTGFYVSPPGGLLNTPCTLSATRGAITIGAP